MSTTTKEIKNKKTENLNSKLISDQKRKTKSKTVSVKEASTKSNVKDSKKDIKVSKKINTEKTPSKKKNTKKSIKSIKQQINLLEYYDLPYRYNKTVVKILAQTPKTLFVYWDISDSDRENYIKQYGENFFENTKPVLIIHNSTMNYTFEIEINDFANCWYFNINDEKCEYHVELGRRPKDNNNNIIIPNKYLYITSSNKIESPNGHILFEKKQKTLYYRNVKTNETYSKNIANLEFIQYFGRIYNINAMYKKIYKNDEEYLKLENPTSKFN